ncbi:MAG TPA: hypothetical protein VFM93_13810 [Candidatus Limnocylindria bacterium]|nr:hypothetical protein [Candidatus Limnocylindria bacterium]
MLGSPLDHVKWFTDPAAYPTRYDLLLTLPVLAALALAAVAVAVAYAWERRFPEPRVVKALERWAEYAPTALGIHVGVALVVASLLGYLFVPSTALHMESDNAFGFMLLTLEALCGGMLVAGLAARAAAAILALLGVVAMIPFTIEAILEQVHFLGIALFVFLVGRGPFSFDRMRHAAPPVRSGAIPWIALGIARVAMGFGIFYNALTEKLLNPALAATILEERPFLNVFRAAGVSDGQFVWLAGTVELMVGAVILSPWVTRPVMVVGAALFSVSLLLFGWRELLGHLPFYGLFLLLLLAPKADSPRVRRAMKPAA